MNLTYLFYIIATGLLLIGSISLAVFSLIGGFNEYRRRRLRFCSLVIILLIGTIALFAYPRLMERASDPSTHEGVRDMRSADGAILQSTHYTCAPAALANLVALHGMNVNEKEMAKLCETTAYGTPPAKMVQAMISLGYQAELQYLSIPDLASLSEPTILFVDHPATGRESHSIVYLGKLHENSDQSRVIDPLRGRTVISELELGMIYHGRAMACEPPDSISSSQKNGAAR